MSHHSDMCTRWSDTYIRRPLLARGHQAVRSIVHPTLNPFQPPCSMFHAVCCILSPVSLQLVVVVCPGNQYFTTSWLGPLNFGCPWEDPEIHWNPKEPPTPSKIFKMSPGDPQSLQNGLQNGAWNHQIMEIVEKLKSNENHNIYYVFERLGHWKTDDFPFKIHQGTWLQCRSAFCDSKTQKVSKRDSKLTPAGTP